MLLPIRRSRVDPLLRPVHAFLSVESAGGVVLLVSAVVALVWANSPWGDTYAAFWHTKVSFSAGPYGHAMSLEHWVNDGLMVVFFLLVGLEIKRELLLGELASVRQATLPVAAALGGMIVPALIYAGINHGGAGAAGWGVPMATDIAFAVGVLALVGRRVPTSVKVFLLAIAIVDDLGAIVVIAVFYTSQVSLGALGVAGVFGVGLVMLNVLRVHRPLPYILLGLGLWAATLASGVHATIAGVLLAFTIPASRQIEEQPYVAYIRNMLSRFERDSTAMPDKITHSQSHAIKAMEEASQAVQTPLARVEHALLRPTNFLIVPLFALANAGVDVRSGVGPAVNSPVMWGVLGGLLVGKPVGILLASWLAIRSGLGAMPLGASRLQIIGVGALCGIGFTMSLFVANLAFPGDTATLSAAKVGILVASILSGVLGGALIAMSGRRTVGQDQE
ncbi:MAG TPA: Na+/H+ antiporter NhaA [Tepidisphaeraceae bacterium]